MAMSSSGGSMGNSFLAFFQLLPTTYIPWLVAASSTFKASSAGLSEGPQNLNPFFHYQHFSNRPLLSLFYL